MKQSLFKWGIAPLVAGALLAPAQMMGQAVKTQTVGWLVAEPLPGILCVNASGLLRQLGEVHVVRLESADPGATGRATAVMNLEEQADGTATFEGTAALELGTWDSAGNFTRTDGVWDLKYSGVVNADGSIVYRMSGRGIGGSVEGQHIIVTATKASKDPRVPYYFSSITTGKAGK